MFTKHIDCGDFVVIVNAENLVVTGNKGLQKVYYRHSGFPGGIKSRTLDEAKALDPTVVLAKAIRGMLPVNKLRDERLNRLKIYAGAEHKHAPQQPTVISVKETK